MNSEIYTDQFFMQQALLEAKEAYDAGEVPIGAVVVVNDMIIGRGHNLTESLQDVTAHAEMLAITAAQNYLGSKVLPDATLYVTIEPCVMCAGALRWSRIGRVVWGASEPKVGFTQFSSKILHKKTIVTSGVMEEDAVELMQRFFQYRR